MNRWPQSATRSSSIRLPGFVPERVVTLARAWETCGPATTATTESGVRDKAWNAGISAAIVACLTRPVNLARGLTPTRRSLARMPLSAKSTRSLPSRLRLSRVKCFQKSDQRCFVAIRQFEFTVFTAETKRLFHVGPQNH